MKVHIILLAFLFTRITTSQQYFGADDEEDMVTCGSMVTLQHLPTKFYLHSHDIAWGSGSRQQSVTAINSDDDHGNYWIIKEPFQSEVCESGMPIPCGSEIRLEHVATKKNLHTHAHSSPLSRHQEVSCFLEGENGDQNDNWKVLCHDDRAEFWTYSQPVRLVSVSTGALLASSQQHRFDDKNCPRCPVSGQQEVAGWSKYTSESLWQLGDRSFRILRED